LRLDNDDAGMLPVATLPVNDIALLMHYLDHVFPLLFPMYEPEGGRSWLLALLLKSKPFYHAALTLSACVRRDDVSTQSSRAAMLLQQEEHLELCLKLLSHSAQNSCSNDGLGMLAAVIHAMFFEVRIPYRSLFLS
jgi:hypothetical protein